MGSGDVRLLMTGGSGRLGRALRVELEAQAAAGHETPYAHFATSSDADVTDAAAVARLIDEVRPDVVLHAAGYTDVLRAEQDRAACWRVNVDGTRTVANETASTGARLVQVSSDYVFFGGDDRPDGGYREDDPVGPVRNYYALSKLVAEEAARRAPQALIVRTSFRPSEWLHPVAFDDLFTGQDYVDVIAKEFALLLSRLDELPDGILHLVTERKSVYELVRRRTPEVRRGSRRDAAVELPEDVSLNTDLWQALKAGRS